MQSGPIRENAEYTEDGDEYALPPFREIIRGVRDAVGMQHMQHAAKTPPKHGFGLSFEVSSILGS